MNLLKSLKSFGEASIDVFFKVAYMLPRILNGCIS